MAGEELDLIAHHFLDAGHCAFYLGDAFAARRCISAEKCKHRRARTAAAKPAERGSTRH